MVRLTARFIKVNTANGDQDFDESYWVVLNPEMEDSTLFKISVKELKRSNPILDYEIIATMEFGKRMIRKAKELKVFW